MSVPEQAARGPTGAEPPVSQGEQRPRRILACRCSEETTRLLRDGTSDDRQRLFPSVEDVYRIKRNVLERRRRNRRLQHMRVFQLTNASMYRRPEVMVTHQNEDTTRHSAWSSLPTLTTKKAVSVLLSLGCEGFFSALAGIATFDFLAVHWSWLASLLASTLVGVGIFSLALFTLLWQVPAREAISAFSVRHGDDPTDLVFFLRVPMALAVLAESVGVALVVGGPLPPSLLSGLRWGVLQVLVLIAPLLQVPRARRRIGTLPVRLHLSLRRGKRQEVEGKKHE